MPQITRKFCIGSNPRKTHKIKPKITKSSIIQYKIKSRFKAHKIQTQQNLKTPTNHLIKPETQQNQSLSDNQSQKNKPNCKSPTPKSANKLKSKHQSTLHNHNRPKSSPTQNTPVKPTKHKPRQPASQQTPTIPANTKIVKAPKIRTSHTQQPKAQTSAEQPQSLKTTRQNKLNLSTKKNLHCINPI